MRGTWFLEKGSDWVPLRETVADELETAYRSQVCSDFLQTRSVSHASTFSARCQHSSAVTELSTAVSESPEK